jgi:hypothetical protein
LGIQHGVGAEKKEVGWLLGGWESRRSNAGRRQNKPVLYLIMAKGFGGE